MVSPRQESMYFLVLVAFKEVRPSREVSASRQKRLKGWQDGGFMHG